MEKFVSNIYIPTTLPDTILDLYRDMAQAKSEPANRLAALAIINEYFNFFGRSGMRQDMWLLLTGALTSSEINKLNEGVERHSLFFFYEFTLMLIDAAFIIHDQDN